MKVLPLLTISLALLASGCSQESQVAAPEKAAPVTQPAVNSNPTTSAAPEPAPGMMERAKEMGSAALDKSKQAYEDAKEKTGDMTEKAVEKSKAMYQSAKEQGSEMTDKAVEKTKEIYQSAKEQGAELTEKTMDKSKEVYESAKDKAGEMMNQSAPTEAQPAMPMDKPQG